MDQIPNDSSLQCSETENLKNDEIQPKPLIGGNGEKQEGEGQGEGGGDERGEEHEHEVKVKPQSQRERDQHQPEGLRVEEEVQEGEVSTESTKKADIRFFCKVYYEERAMFEWQYMFTVVKDLDVLRQYIKKNRPQFEEQDYAKIILKPQCDVEFDIQKYHHEIPYGWEINPRRRPLKLKRTSITMFGSMKYSEPPSCFVDVYADQGDSTAKRLHYKVPLLGVKESVEICINLSLRQRYNATKVKTGACYRDPNFASDELIKIIQDVLSSKYSYLNDLLKAALKSFAIEMYSHGLISETTKDTANFNDIMREFKSGMNFICDIQELVKYCELFLQSLVKQKGPHNRVASTIAQEWTTSIKERLDINIKFDVE